jgi:outer membrane protein OmpA-like peptidoglycan-associated protein
VITPAGDQANYSTSYIYVAGTLTLVAPGHLTITASSEVVQAGDPVTTTTSLAGLLSGDTGVISSVTITYQGTGATTYGPSTTAPSVAGSYSVTPSATTVVITPGADQAVYHEPYSYVAGTLLITPAPITIVNAPPPVPPTTFTIKSFGEGSYKLTAKLKKQVHALALKIKAGRYHRVELAGYTDNVFTPALNAVLTQNRAAVVSTALKKFLKALHVKNVKIVIVSGVTITLVTLNTTPQFRAENRRVVATLRAK